MQFILLHIVIFCYTNQNMATETKAEAAGETLITVRIPKGLMEKIEAVMAERFSTKSEYIRDLIRRDVLETRPITTTEEAA